MYIRKEFLEEVAVHECFSSFVDFFLLFPLTTFAKPHLIGISSRFAR